MFPSQIYLNRSRTILGLCRSVLEAVFPDLKHRKNLWKEILYTSIQVVLISKCHKSKAITRDGLIQLSEAIRSWRNYMQLTPSTGNSWLVFVLLQHNWLRKGHEFCQPLTEWSTLEQNHSKHELFSTLNNWKPLLLLLSFCFEW